MRRADPDAPSRSYKPMSKKSVLKIGVVIKTPATRQPGNPATRRHGCRDHGSYAHAQAHLNGGEFVLFKILCLVALSPALQRSAVR